MTEAPHGAFVYVDVDVDLDVDVDELFTRRQFDDRRGRSETRS
jgi:hypothetical protein